jgi:GNAT superfamily N-acetyltransferase
MVLPAADRDGPTGFGTRRRALRWQRYDFPRRIQTGYAERMPDVLHDPSDEAIRAAIDLNWRASSRAFGLDPATVIRDDDELFWYVTGIPSAAFNSIMYANLAPERIDVAVAELHALRERHGVPIGWLVGPSSRPADLGTHLLARGLRHQVDLTPMTRSLVELPAVEPVAGLTIERVEDPSTYEAWIVAEQRGFASHDDDDGGLAVLRRAMGIRHGFPLHLFLGRLDGAPVATATLLPAGGIAGIYDVSTVPDARRRGIGTAMTLAALQAARGLGYETAFLQPSAMGRPLYERIGVRQRCVC